MSGLIATLVNPLKSNWYHTDLRTRIIMPMMLVLTAITSFAGYSFYTSERSRLLEELGIRGQALTASLAAYASSMMTGDKKPQLEAHALNFIKEKNLLHQVSFFRGDRAYLDINSNALREKIRPQTLRLYESPLYSADGRTQIGRVEIGLSTQEIDDYLSVRIVHIVLISLVVVLASSALLYWLIGRWIIQPLERLTHKIQMISMGRLNQQVVSLSWDEIGHLFRDINALRVRFRKKQDELIEAIVRRRHFEPQSLANTSSSALIIDDDPVIQAHAKMLLEKGGIKVTLANSAKQGLDLLQQQRFDIILLDLMMPAMTGYEFLNEYRKMQDTHHAPVIVVSSIEDKTSIVRALQGGASDYVVKPFNTQELMARVNLLLNLSIRDREIDSMVDERIAQLKRMK